MQVPGKAEPHIYYAIIFSFDDRKMQKVQGVRNCTRRTALVSIRLVSLDLRTVDFAFYMRDKAPTTRIDFNFSN